MSFRTLSNIFNYDLNRKHPGLRLTSRFDAAHVNVGTIVVRVASFEDFFLQVDITDIAFFTGEFSELGNLTREGFEKFKV